MGLLFLNRTLCTIKRVRLEVQISEGDRDRVQVGETIEINPS